MKWARQLPFCVTAMISVSKLEQSALPPHVVYLFWREFAETRGTKNTSQVYGAQRAMA